MIAFDHRVFSVQRTKLFHSRSGSSLFPAGSLGRGLLAPAALLSSVMACVEQDAADGGVAPAEASPAAAEVATHASAIEAQAQVDALLLAASALDDQLATIRTGAAGETARQLEATIGELAQAAESLRAGVLTPAARLEAVRALSRRAGQIGPQLRKLKKALASSELSAGDRQAIATAAAQVRWTAKQLNRSAGRYQAETERHPLAARADQRLRNGPLFPGSTFWVLDEGHIDPIDAAFEDGELELAIHDETAVPDVEREHEHTIMVVKAAAKLEVPDTRFSFIGPVGRPFWLLPEGQLEAEAAGVLWPGLSAEEVEPGVFVNDEVQFRFKEVHGPNGLSLFVSPADESSAPEVKVDSEGGLPDVITIPAGSHQHLNWAFESAGIYLVRADVRGRLAVAGTPWVTSATETLMFVVLP
jgi:surface-anchored protein